MIHGARILLVEDDQDLAGIVGMHLRDQGHAVDVASDGPNGLEQALTGVHSLVVLDVMLPKMDGFDVCRKLRAAGSRMPVLMLTARSEEIDRVLGLEIGADDYLTKPFSARELQARVMALLRRVEMDASGAGQDLEELRFGQLVVSPRKRSAMLDGAPLSLTAKEYDLLELFARNPGCAYSRNELLRLVWGYDYDGYSHTVNTHINRLRGKLNDDPAEPTYIKTVWGHGYRFIDPDEVAP